MNGNGFYCPPPPLSGRDRWLLGLLNVSLAIGLIVFLIVSTQGWALWFFGVVGGLAVLGVVHYFLWGRAMEKSTKAERQRWLREQQASQPISPPSSWARRF